MRGRVIGHGAGSDQWGSVGKVIALELLKDVEFRLKAGALGDEIKEVGVICSAVESADDGISAIAALMPGQGEECGINGLESALGIICLTLEIEDVLH